MYLGFWFWFLGFNKCFMFSKDIWYILPKIHFMFLIDMKFIYNMLQMFFMETILSRSSSPQKYFKNMYSWLHKKTENEDKNKQGTYDIHFSNKTFLSPRLTNIIFSRMPPYFLVFLKHFGNNSEVSGSII